VAKRLQLARLIALGLPLALLGGAYVSQYSFGLYPCEMCWWQRYPHFAATGLALSAFVLRPAAVYVALAGLAILSSGLIGLFHAGVEYQWWTGFTACTSPVAADPDPLKAILAAPVVRCDVAPWSLFGISLAGWNFLVSVSGAVAIFVLLRKARP